MNDHNRFPAPVGLDVSAAQRPRTTGWERFIRALSVSLSAIGVPVEPLGFQRTSGGRLRTLVRQLSWYGWGLRASAARTGVALVHAAAFPPPQLDRPTVWTVHDAIILGGHPEYARASSRFWAPLGRRALSYVSLVVTDTIAVRAELESLGVPREKLRVVRPGVPPLPPPSDHDPHLLSLSTGQRRTPLPSEFVLAVGTMENRKRPDVAAEIAERVGIPIVFAGRLDRSFDARRLGSWPHVHVAPHVQDDQLSLLYHRSHALIAASEYEGFDFPVAEARCVGTPVLASDIAVHREVAPDATFFPVGDVETGASRLERLLDSPSPGAVKGPSWNDAARGYRGIYVELLADTRHHDG